MGLFDFFSGVVKPVIGDFGGTVGPTSNQLAQDFTPQNTFQVQPGENLAQIQNQQQALAAALLAQSQGAGPNPAQAMLNQQTNQNIQQNAGFIASQKGINPALSARLASENAGTMNQQAAASGATLGAQQQLAAQQGLGTTLNQLQQGTMGANQINAGVSAQNAAANQNTAGGFLNSAGSAIKMFGMANGGPVGGSQQIANELLAQAGIPGFAAGNASSSSTPLNFSSMMGKPGAVGESSTVMAAAKGGKIPSHIHQMAAIFHPQMLAHGGVSLLLSPGERVLSPEETKKAAEGKVNPLKEGVKVPGKAKVKGDSYANDVVPAKAAEGSFVIPRHIMETKDPKVAEAFIAKEMKKTGKYDEQGTEDEFHAALKAAVGSRKGK